MSGCCICLEDVKGIICSRCQATTCLPCEKSFLFTSPSLTCPNCPQEWSIEFLSEYFPSSFFKKEFKERMKKILFDQEKVRFAETQEMLRFQRCLLYQKYKKLNVRLPYVRMNSNQKVTILNRIGGALLYANAKWIYRQIDNDLVPYEAGGSENLNANQEELVREIETKLEPILIVLRKYDQENANIRLEDQTEYMNDSFPCPRNGCKGFVKEGLCMMCRVPICEDCWEEGSSEHSCDEDKKANVKLIKSDTKKCPSCKTFIHRIDGCNHMYCTRCKCRFDYLTGKIYTNSRWFHNPHEREEREQSDRLCGLGFTFNYDSYLTDHVIGHPGSKLPFYHQLFEGITNYLQDNATWTHDNLDLRIKYLLGYLPEEKFIQEILYRWKVRSLFDEENAFLMGFVDEYVALINKHREDPEECRRDIKHLLRDLINHLDEASEKYGLTPFNIEKPRRRILTVNVDEEEINRLAH